MKSLSLCIAVVLASVSCFAEFRIWEDSSGHIWEGDFVTLNADKVVLLNQSGEKQEHEIATLCRADLEYIDKMVPPTLNIDVTKTTDNAGGSNRAKLKCHVSIKQASTRKYSGNLTMVMLVMGQDIRTGATSVSSRTEENFTLPENTGDAVEFSSSSSTFSKSASKKGRIYVGYIVVVWDRFGNPITIETNKPAFEEDATKLAYLSLKNRNLKLIK